MITGNTERAFYDIRNHQIEIGIESNIGNREKQQDVAIVSTNDYEYESKHRITLAILCDGMGGMSGGELASSICANTMHDEFYKNNVEDYNAFLVKTIDMADKLVSELKDESGRPRRAGTTLVAVIIVDNQLYWASVGDSRMYIVRNNHILQATTDHNYFMELLEKVKKNKISIDDAYKDKEAASLTSFIGMGGVTKIDMNKNPFELQQEDCIVMCSDGLYRTLDERMMKNIVLQHGDNMKAAAIDLVGEALSKRKRNQDNTTVIAMKYLRR